MVRALFQLILLTLAVVSATAVLIGAFGQWRWYADAQEFKSAPMCSRLGQTGCKRMVRIVNADWTGPTVLPGYRKVIGGGEPGYDVSTEDGARLHLSDLGGEDDLRGKVPSDLIGVVWHSGVARLYIDGENEYMASQFDPEAQLNRAVIQTIVGTISGVLSMVGLFVLGRRRSQSAAE